MWAVAFGLGGIAAAAPPSPVLTEVDSDELATVVRALSSRDPVTCSAIESLTSTPVPTLLAVVDGVTMPPYAPMRAADCLIRGHAAEVQPQLERWVVAPELKGLGRLVLSGIDAMPLEVALPVVRTAIATGSDPDLAVRKAGAAVAPEIRALVVQR
jgi:hypothetical protein